jgi:L-2,4-diaminobutyrate transaminase
MVGAHMRELLEAMRRSHSIVGEIRGVGLFMAVELMRDPAGKEAFPPEMRVDDQVAAVAHDMGLFVRPVGGTILLAPPLIFTKAQADRTVEILDTALTKVEAGMPCG